MSKRRAISGENVQGSFGYVPQPSQLAFHQSHAKWRLLLGGWGSGKTKALIWEAIAQSVEQPGNFGLIGRYTYRELEDSTKRMFFEECPSSLIIKVREADNQVWLRPRRKGQAPSVIAFRALDDWRKHQGINYGFFAIDEVGEIEEPLVFTTLQFRCRRNTGKDGKNCGLMASNPTNINHWLYKIFEKKIDPLSGHELPDPGEYEVFHAQTYENAAHLPADYIPRLEQTAEAVRRKFLMGEWGHLGSGTTVYPEFRRHLHVECLRPLPGRPVWRGIDFGFRHPACVWVQRDLRGRTGVLRELMGENISTTDFLRQIMEVTDQYYQDMDVIDVVDPAGNDVLDSGESCIQQMRKLGLLPRFQRMTIAQGIEVVRQSLNTLVDGKPMLLVDPSCRTLIEGFEGGYIIDKKRDRPQKDGFYEHLQDALRYCLVQVIRPVSHKYTGRPFPGNLRPAMLQ